MPPLELMDRHTTVVYWPKSSVTRYGEPTRGAAVELTVRWEDGRRSFRTPQNDTVWVDTTIVTDRELTVDGVIWRGALEDFVDGDNEVLQVVAGEVALDLKGRNTRYEYGLKRFRETLPT